ncbi:MAG: DUF4412 domain-containing protein [Ignavibacterium sp.]|nr:DUF4412 domain-containing protein [Ignavibacterium sp.]
MKNVKNFIELISVIVLLLFTSSAFGQFKAKMFFTSMGEEHLFYVYSTAEGYRYEFNEDGQEGVVIVKKESPEVIILMPEQKMAMKNSKENPMTMGNDPIGSYKYFSEKGSVKEIGTETINGLECIKSELWNENSNEYGEANQKMYTIWTSVEYNFPIKMINHIEGSEDAIMEMKDVEPWEVDSRKFEIPSDYHVMDLPGMSPDK